MADEKGNRLHQLLAVEPELRKGASRISQETITTFSKKGEHFDGLTQSYEPLIEDDDNLKVAPKIKEIVTTVAEKLEYSQKAIGQALDAQLSKEQTNASGEARSFLVCDGVDFGELSAQALLALEGQMVNVRAMYSAIPTLDPVHRWEIDEQKKSTFVTQPIVSYKMEKQPKVITLAPPTDHHPAQTELIYVDKQVGAVTTVHSSGKLTPKTKSDFLERIDNVIRAVKRARSKANQAAVVRTRISEKLFRYIDTGQ